jgi:hypothetical protein
VPYHTSTFAVKWASTQIPLQESATMPLDIVFRGSYDFFQRFDLD